MLNCLLDQRWLTDHIPEWLIALFTGTLWWSTRRLWIATKETLKHARDTTEVLQRAYVSAQPGGIELDTRGYPLAHVDFKDVGHLPAYDFKWHIGDLTTSDQDDWRPPLVPDSDLRPSGALPIATTFTRGSGALDREVPKKFIYTWGRVTYLDGFDKPRFTNFCHRYNMGVKEAKAGGGYRISAKKARYHDYCNEAN